MILVLVSLSWGYATLLFYLIVFAHGFLLILSILDLFGTHFLLFIFGIIPSLRVQYRNLRGLRCNL